MQVKTLRAFLGGFLLAAVVAPSMAQAAASIAINPASGPAGTPVAITGSGFAPETGYALYYDDTYANLRGGTDAHGGIGEFVFTIPPSTVGDHRLKIVDDRGNAAEQIFAVTASAAITIAPTSGPAGTSVTITGSGFAPVTGYSVYYDDANQFVRGATDPGGGIGAFAFRIPRSAVGDHRVRIVDDYGNAAEQIFAVAATATIAIDPTSGKVGTLVTITGSGFAPSTGYALYYDGTLTSVRGATRSDGGIDPFTYAIPASSVGDHTLKVVDDYGNEAVQVFTFIGSNFTIAVNGMRADEGDSGTTPFTFTVTVNNPAQQGVDVTYYASDGTATAPADFFAISGVLSCPPGVTHATYTVQVVGDRIQEPDENFYLNATGTLNGTTVTDRGTATIVNDDPPGSLKIDDVSGVEHYDGTVTFRFTVTLSSPSAQSVSVAVATATGPILTGGTNGSATAGVDFIPAATSLAFPPGTTQVPFDVQVYGDPDHEIDETFSVLLLGTNNATIADNRGTGTILDDDLACVPQAGDVPTLRVSTAGGQLQFSWTDASGGALYSLYESPIPSGPILTEAGTAVSGAAGISLPMPAGSLFYLLASGSAACGAGPRRSCGHDRCVAGERLDSACSVCVADICAAAPACCGVAWNAACVSMVQSVCGVTCN